MKKEKHQMKITSKKLLKWEIAEVLFTAVLGTLFHFIYEWSKEAFIVGLFAPVNESIFEHLKLVLVPILLFTVIQYVFVKELRPCLFDKKAKTALAGMAFIVIFYFTYTGIIKRNLSFLDVGSFYAAVLINAGLAYRLLKKADCEESSEYIGAQIWGILLLLMVLGTLFPMTEWLPGLFVPPN